MCSPTRAALLTGRYQQRSGVERVLGPDPGKTPGMPADELTFAHLFHRAGYATGMFGKYHTGHIPLQSPRKMGFDTYRGNNGGMDHHSRFNRWGEGSWYHNETLVEEEDGYSTDLITDHALEFVEDQRGCPFLLYIADWMVHFPWQGPGDPADFSKGVDNSGVDKKYGSVVDRKRAYREMVEAMDASIGRIGECLHDLGLSDNTFFFFASDNGGHELICDNRPLNGAKGSMLEGGHRVPAIAFWPGTFGEGIESDETVMLSDLFPTILETASIPKLGDRHLDGI
jgi:arylsulfatase A-like enzyme